MAWIFDLAASSGSLTVAGWIFLPSFVLLFLFANVVSVSICWFVIYFSHKGQLWTYSTLRAQSTIMCVVLSSYTANLGSVYDSDMSPISQWYPAGNLNSYLIITEVSSQGPKLISCSERLACRPEDKVMLIHCLGHLILLADIMANVSVWRILVEALAPAQILTSDLLARLTWCLSMHEWLVLLFIWFISTWYIFVQN